MFCEVIMAGVRELTLTPQRTGIRWGRRAQDILWRTVVFALLCVLVIPFAWPVFWMLSTSLKSLEQTLRFPPEWLPNPVQFSNYPKALTEVVPLWRYFLNNTYYAVLATFGEVLSSALVGYGFAKFRAPGRRLFFLLVISTILLPYPVVMIPQYILFHRLGWLDTYLPLIAPSFFASAFLIFLFRQFMQGISPEILDAARIDGAGPLMAFVRIVLPLARPVVLAASILAFSYHWSNYLGPLLYINSSEKYTLQVGLVHFIAHRGQSHWELLMAASVISVLPVAILFFVAQRVFMQGVVITGIK
ncbi:MAG: carbohydrate ABC transporter permease [Caldilinea sp. CFX5]|nr:carbohydrate ABC transporter permease [Caldilinea sp. CFX5]